MRCLGWVFRFLFWCLFCVYKCKAWRRGVIVLCLYLIYVYVRPPVWICVLCFSTNLIEFNLNFNKFDRMLKYTSVPYVLYNARPPDRRSYIYAFYIRFASAAYLDLV